MKIYFYLLFFLCPSLINAQKTSVQSKFRADERSEVRKVTINYNPSFHQIREGYVVDIDLIYQFINCFGELHLALTRDDKTMKSKSYWFEGNLYSARDLGMADNQGYFTQRPFFTAISKLSAKIVSGYRDWGWIDMTNIIDFEIGGCIGQAFPIVEFIKKYNGSTQLTDKDIMQFIKSDLNGLDAIEFKVIDAYTRDEAIESAIRALKKKADYNVYINEGDKAFKNKSFETAANNYKEAYRLKPNEKYPQEKYRESRFRQSEAEGDTYARQGNKTEARKSYKKALEWMQGQKDVIAKLNALGTDDVENSREIVSGTLKGMKWCEYKDQEKRIWTVKEVYFKDNMAYFKIDYYYENYVHEGWEDHYDLRMKISDIAVIVFENSQKSACSDAHAFRLTAKNYGAITGEKSTDFFGKYHDKTNGQTTENGITLSVKDSEKEKMIAALSILVKKSGGQLQVSQ